MPLSTFPVYHFPTTVVFVDDNEVLLESFRKLFSSQYRVKCFKNAESVLKYLSDYLPAINQDQFIKSYEHESNEIHDATSVDLLKVARLSSFPLRYKEISTIVIDYDMPEMDGLLLCKKLKKLPFKKILLTSKASESEVISAFNSKEINAFITKSDDTFLNILGQTLVATQEDYFIEQTANIAGHINAVSILPESHDPIFSNFLKALLENHNITESFLIDKNGSRILLDNEKNKKILVVYTDEVLDEFTSLYTEDDGVYPYIEIIKKRSKLPFFGVGMLPEKLQSQKWDKYMYRAQTLEGKKRYYWFLTR